MQLNEVTSAVDNSFYTVLSWVFLFCGLPNPPVITFPGHHFLDKTRVS